MLECIFGDTPRAEVLGTEHASRRYDAHKSVKGGFSWVLGVRPTKEWNRSRSDSYTIDRRRPTVVGRSRQQRMIPTSVGVSAYVGTVKVSIRFDE